MVHICKKKKKLKLNFKIKKKLIKKGSEQSVGAPSNLLENFSFYSGKKGQHSITKLMVMGCDGRILWMSASYPGSKTDAELVHICLKEWLNILNCDDINKIEWGLGDSAFSGMSDYRLVGTPSGNKTGLSKLHSHFRIEIGIFFLKN